MKTAIKVMFPILVVLALLQVALPMMIGTIKSVAVEVFARFAILLIGISIGQAISLWIRGDL